MPGRIAYNRPNYEGGRGQFNPAYHYEMVSDAERVGQIKAAIDATVTPETVFCELGAGTGIFSIYAARKARKVYAVEIDPATAAFARRNIENAGMSDRITLIEGDATRVALPERVDVTLCEMLSTGLIEEPEVPALNWARSELLKPGGVTIPGRICNMVELCQTQYVFDGIEIRCFYFEFAGIRKPRLLSRSACYHIADFAQPVPETVDVRCPVEIIAGGVANCVRLTSIVELAPGVIFYSTDSLMPPIVLPLQADAEVAPGMRTLGIRYPYRTDLRSVEVWVE
jgi:predicted RNA methylase